MSARNACYRVAARIPIGNTRQSAILLIYRAKQSKAIELQLVVERVERHTQDNAGKVEVALG
jgi:hypothetical protein